MTAPNARVSMLLFALLGMLGCGSPLVGLQCREGFTRCGDGCYDLASDPAHCGTCALSCGPAESCSASACVDAPPDGGPLDDGGMSGDGGDAGTSMDGGSDGGSDGGEMDADTDGATPDDASTAPDTSAPPNVPCTGPGSPPECACDLGQLKCGLTCIDALTDPANCGACGNACAVNEVCAAGLCAPRCGTLTLCGTICVDLDDDVDHCGSCINPCAPGAACINGDCVGSAVGHVVAIGHDMTASRPPMRTLVGNAVFLVRSAPVRVLLYDAATSAASRTGITDAIRLSAQNLGRTYALTQATADQVSLQLSAADVFVIAPQQTATDAELQALGHDVWSIALDTFVRRGGVVLMFDAGGGANAGTFQTLGVSGANLLQVTGLTAPFPSRRLQLRTFSDAIAAGVPNEYQSEGLTVGFQLPMMPIPSHVEVVRDSVSGWPVVIHIAPAR